MYEVGVWVEVTTLLMPGLNDSREELEQVAAFIAEVDPNLPWHVTAFRPTYKMTDRPPTGVESLRMARQIGHDAGLYHVFEGNIPGSGGENTYCPGCGTELISRVGFTIRRSRLVEGRCPDCRQEIAGVWYLDT
jgi:pyruvate formate lyase activating enzyme